MQITIQEHITTLSDALLSAFISITVSTKKKVLSFGNTQIKFGISLTYS